jgi:hypothetical protein
MFLTYATSNMDKSKEISGVSLRGFGTTLKFGTTFKQFESIKGQDLKVGEKVPISTLS